MDVESASKKGRARCAEGQKFGQQQGELVLVGAGEPQRADPMAREVGGCSKSLLTAAVCAASFELDQAFESSYSQHWHFCLPLRSSATRYSYTSRSGRGVWQSTF
jgi:hypothetical protein